MQAVNERREQIGNMQVIFSYIGFITSDLQRNAMGQSPVRCHHLLLCFLDIPKSLGFFMKIFNIHIKLVQSAAPWEDNDTVFVGVKSDLYSLKYV